MKIDVVIEEELAGVHKRVGSETPVRQKFPFGECSNVYMRRATAVVSRENGYTRNVKATSY